MRLPGFTADASLYRRGGYDLGRGGETTGDAGLVAPQQRIIRSNCVEQAVSRNNQCISRCSSIWRRFRFQDENSVEECERQCNSTYGSDLWACRYSN